MPAEIRFVAALLAVAASLGAADDGPLSAERAAKVRKHVVPRKTERRWGAIPWRPTLWDAVVEANRTKKPILLWAMNGHPLALT